MTKITSEWLESIGFGRDGDDKANQEFGKRAWSISHAEDNFNDEIANAIQVLVSVDEQSIWLETYSNVGGTSLALIEVPGGSQERVLALCEALGIQLAMTEKTTPDESPEVDWVTQDRVPAREGLDQRRYTENRHVGKWCNVGPYSKGLMHGEKDVLGAVIELRCRREDLPTIELPAKDDPSVTCFS